MKNLLFVLFFLMSINHVSAQTVKNDVMAAKRYVEVLSGQADERLYYMGCVKDSAGRRIVLRWELRDSVGNAVLLAGDVEMDVSGVPSPMHKMNITESVYLFEHIIVSSPNLTGVEIKK